MKFPNKNPKFGEQIDSFLKMKTKFEDKMLHLLFTLNRWEMKGELEELLNMQNHVILDRYCYSGVAYSCAKGVDY